MIQLRPYQSALVQEVRESFRKHNHVIMQSPTASGKCLGKDTPVLMYDGSIKNVQDIVVGDLLMGDDSQPRRVESTCIGYGNMYRITPKKGDSFTCNEDHILSLKLNSSDTSHGNKGDVVDIDIKTYLSSTKTFKWVAKQFRSDVEFCKKQTGIDPYILGLWLADGSKTNGSPSLSINNKDAEILKYASELGAILVPVEKNNYVEVRFTGEKFNVTDKELRWNKTSICNIYRREFLKCMEDRNHRDIFIPSEYKINSRENRLRLLAGIIDGDGYMSGGGYDMVTKFPRLADDILFLCRSLGLAAYKSVKRVDVSKLNSNEYDNGRIKEYFRISISGDIAVIPVMLDRRKAPYRKMNKDVRNVGFSIEYIGEGDYYGFEISGNNRRFLLGDFTVTHNTICFSYIAQNAYKKGKRIMICSDRTELLTQNGGALERFNLTPEYISPRTKHIPTGQVCVSMIQTITRRIKSKPEWLYFLHSFDLLIIDEAHCQTANHILSSLSDKTYVIGATATPIRSAGQRQLGEDYSHIVTGCSVKHLLSLGFIVPCDHYTVDAPDLSSITIDYKKGDYNTKQMSKVFERKEKYEGIVKEWLRLTPNTKTICFCSSSEQAIQITKEFTGLGVSAKYLLSGNFDEDDMYSGERSELIEELRTGDLTVLVNVGIAVAGLDVPNLETCITAFATMSLSKWLQALGRCARISPGKSKYVCLDFGGNVQRLGLYQDDRKWGLWYETKNGGTSVAPTKLCPEDKPDINGKIGCGALMLSTAKKCPFCGYYFATEREVYEAELSLVTEDGRDEKQHLDVWIANRIKMGWKNNWILTTLCAKNSDNPKKAYMEAIKYLRTKEGKPINPQGWKFFKENILEKKKK